jgi:hypothetical protein
MSKKLLLLTLVALFATTYAQDIGDGNATDGNGNGIGDTVNGVPTVGDKVEAGLDDAADAVSSGVTTAADATASGVSTAVDATVGAATTGADATASALEPVAVAVTGAMGAMWSVAIAAPLVLWV